MEVWTPKDDFPAIESDRLMWAPAGAARPFELTLEELFRPI